VRQGSPCRRPEGIAAQREAKCTRNSRDWLQVSAAIAMSPRATRHRRHDPFGSIGSFIQPKHRCSILSSGTRLARDAHGREADMGQNGLEEFIAEFRLKLPAQSKTAQAIDRKDPFEKIAFKAIDEGYVEFVDQFSSFMEVSLRRSTCETAGADK
ncbi:MAG TPA: hypothetical protein VEM38_02885, partial [Burkholderiales bacterium]|nr:hypothetical protein [Burkholderiales bacterium]